MEFPIARYLLTQGNTKFRADMVKIQGISVTTVSHVSAVAFDTGVS